MWLVSAFVRALPLGLARRLGRQLGLAVHALVWVERRRTVEHLAAAFPEQDAAWHRATARAVFAHFGEAGVDFFRLKDLDVAGLDGWIAEVRGLEHLLEGAKLGQGSLVVVPHMGNWELLATWVASRIPLATVARQLFDPRLDKALNDRRAGAGLVVFPRNTPVLPILRWLKDAKVMGVLADQDTGVDSLFCEFFGRPAKTPSGGALLAQVARARLLTAYAWKQADGRYVLEFEGPIPVPGRQDRDPMALWPAVQEYSRRLEAKIRQHPEQWVWMHRRWRSPMDADSDGWRSRQAPACREAMDAYIAAGRPELKP